MTTGSHSGQPVCLRIRTMCMECETVTEKAQAVCVLCVPVGDDDDREPFRAACLSTEYLRDANKVLFAELSAGNEFDSLATCICEVSKRELFWKPTTVFKIEENQTKSKRDFINKMTEVFASESSPYISTESIDNGTFEVNQGNYLFVDYFDNSDALLDFDFDVIQKQIKYVWVLESHSENIKDVDFESIGKRVGEYDVTFFVKASKAEYKMVTFMPTIDRKTCKEVVGNSLEINRCKNGYLTRNVTFPSKNPTNLKQCPLKVGMGSLYPFAIIEHKESLKTFDSLKGVSLQGMDVEMIKIISDYFNATLDLYYIFKYEENPYTYTEYLPLVVNGSLDACAGGLYRIYGDVVEYSGVYARQAVGWFYTADRLTLTWQNLIVNIDGLYLFIVFYLGYSVVWYIICVFDKHAVSMRDTLLYSWGALVGTASLPDAKSLKQKVLNFVYLIMCLHLSVYISIQLYSYLTIRGPPEILKSNDDVINSGRTPYLKSLTKYFITDEKYERFANTSTECSSFLDCSIVSLQKKGVTVIIEGYFLNFQAETVVNDEARILRPTENLLVVYYEMIINKNSPLVKKFQKVVGRLFEAGITVHLFEEAIGITKVDKAMSATRNIIANSYSCQEGCSITFEQISGAFYLWAIGCGVAIALFIVEYTIHEYSTILYAYINLICSVVTAVDD
ncbi:putative ubiquitin specific protease [Operophtera brumata]|uniref:Putative ubiquitin specific protease n=1 Tax=Operophtera brumata TaxID=104452 RepID=A0A0L7KX39_OPEBR|nr:putative ubiquitin specific protease [Operophtera brumata]